MAASPSKWVVSRGELDYGLRLLPPICDLKVIVWTAVVQFLVYFHLVHVFDRFLHQLEPTLELRTDGFFLHMGLEDLV